MKSMWDCWLDETPSMKPKKIENHAFDAIKYGAIAKHGSIAKQPLQTTKEKVVEKFLPHLLLGKPEVISLNPTAKQKDVNNPKDNPDKSMTIADALQMLDDAVPKLKLEPDTPSAVYPGLTAMQALIWVADVIVDCSQKMKHDTFLHPMVACRVRQVFTNTIGKGKGPDETVAAAYELVHPLPPAPPAPSTRPKPHPFERKFS